MLIKVTQECIDNGKRGCPYSCPVALAVRDAVENDDIGVCYNHIRIGASYFVPPTEVIKFLKSFDFGIGGPVEPFEFELDTSNPSPCSPGPQSTQPTVSFG